MNSPEVSPGSKTSHRIRLMETISDPQFIGVQEAAFVSVHADATGLIFSRGTISACRPSPNSCSELRLDLCIELGK